MNTRTTKVMILSVALGLGAALLLGPGQAARAHCQIPCGIYDDTARFAAMREHITTIEKSMKQVIELSSDPAQNANQLVRWVMNKEQHADYLTEIITAYFLQQRIKPLDSATEEERAAYVKKLTLCHEILVASMKAKQTTDLAVVEKLLSLVDGFEAAYLGEEAEHSH